MGGNFICQRQSSYFPDCMLPSCVPDEESEFYGDSSGYGHVLDVCEYCCEADLREDFSGEDGFGWCYGGDAKEAPRGVAEQPRLTVDVPEFSYRLAACRSRPWKP